MSASSDSLRQQRTSYDRSVLCGVGATVKQTRVIFSRGKGNRRCGGRKRSPADALYDLRSYDAGGCLLSIMLVAIKIRLNQTDSGNSPFVIIVIRFGRFLSASLLTVSY
ncbi:hypothetical protein GWI33_009740 [Rhynchophorus ferrugineus]|uniref:Uncharacterized protein n=1 Tax=Rhynchophorus ferrugineus TaxID=354439 RepID=A0A834IBR1_RHYFE|nr:hypothetical protein GWI33_009740 [Rhynchophorus ferrugineus]